jgi:membrane fusion protein, copper/silver efflux system
MRTILFLFLAALALLAVSCQRKGSVSHGDTVYTCSMHPSVRTRNPKAKCPICGMDLVPVTAAGQTNAPVSGEFMVPVARQQQIGVTYATVEKRPLNRTIRAVGTIAYDKQRHWDYVSRVEGYVQKLHVASAGERVEQNQPLLTLYSPELLTTQREFVDVVRMREQARKSGSQAAIENAERLVESAKVRLRLWNIGEPQVAELEKTGKPQETLTLYSPFKGVVQDLAVDQGRRVMPGDHLVDIADLSVVWVWAEFYQEELPLLQKGLPVTISMAAFPGENFNAVIQLIDPFIQEAKRTTRVRIEVQNPDFKLRPDMYVDVELQLSLGESLAIPETAVMPTGKRNVVFVDKGEGRLEPRFVELGNKAEDFYVVLNGLSPGERIVNSANFLIDAEAKIQGALKGW